MLSDNGNNGWLFLRQTHLTPALGTLVVPHTAQLQQEIGLVDLRVHAKFLKRREGFHIHQLLASPARVLKYAGVAVPQTQANVNRSNKNTKKRRTP